MLSSSLGMRRHHATFLVVLLLAAPGLGEAQAVPETEPAEGDGEESSAEQDERARLHFQAGRSHFDAGAFERAAEEFERAYQLSPRPVLLFNVFSAHERAGHVAQALEWLDRYLATDEVDEEERVRLTARRANLQERVDRLQAERDAAERERAEADAERESERDAEQQAAIERERAAAAAALAEGEPTVPVGAVVMYSVGGAALVGFVALAVLSNNEDERLAGTCGADAGAFCSDDQVSTLRTYNILADVALGAGLASLGAATVWLIVSMSGGDGDAERAGLRIAPWVGPNGGGAAATGSF